MHGHHYGHGPAGPELEADGPQQSGPRRPSPTSGVVSSTSSNNQEDLSPVPQCSSSGYVCSGGGSAHPGFTGEFSFKVIAKRI